MLLDGPSSQWEFELFVSIESILSVLVLHDPAQLLFFGPFGSRSGAVLTDVYFLVGFGAIDDSCLDLLRKKVQHILIHDPDLDNCRVGND